MIVVSVHSRKKATRVFVLDMYDVCIPNKKANNKDFFKMIRRKPGGSSNMVQLANHEFYEKPITSA